ncbi:MAG TPA: methyltransferase domain-containing protein [Pseudonocardiaceae bacterium]
MTEDHVPSESDIAAMYDENTDLLAEALGSNIHQGYWDDADDPATPEQATDRLTDMVARRLELRPGMAVLDVGCGSGHSTVRIARLNNVHVTGITNSPYQVRLGQERPEAGEGPGRASFELGDGMALPYADESFDAAFSIEVIVYMSDRAKAFAELARTLRPGGTLVTSDFYQDGELTDEEAATIAAARRVFELPPFPDADEYRRHMTDAGLRVVAFEDISDNVRRGSLHIADAMRRAAAEPGLTEEQVAGLLESADLTERLGRTRQVRYAQITARKP